MAPKVINVNGWTGCPYYQKAKMLASTLVLLYPGKFQVFKTQLTFGSVVFHWGWETARSTSVVVSCRWHESYR